MPRAFFFPTTTTSYLPRRALKSTALLARMPLNLWAFALSIMASLRAFPNSRSVVRAIPTVTPAS